MTSTISRRRFVVCACAVLLCNTLHAGPLRDRLEERRQTQRQTEPLDEDDAPAGKASLPAGVKVLRDLRYGDHPLQRFDVYTQRQARRQDGLAPVVVMVHGGGWKRGDKSMASVVENKVARW